MPIILPTRPKQRGLLLPAGMPTLNWQDPIAAGLLGCWVVTGEGGAASVIRDLVTQSVLPLSGAASIVSGQTGMQAQDAAGAGWRQLTPASQQPTLAFTLLWFGSFISAGAALANAPSLIGSWYNSTGGFPFRSWCICRLAATELYFAWNNSSTFETLTAFPGFLSSGVGTGCVVSSMTVGGTARIYANGQQIASGSAPAGVIAYTSTSPTIVGFSPAIGTANTGAGMSVGMLWGRQLNPGESVDMSLNPTRLLIYPEDELFSMVVGYGAVTPTGRPRVLFVQGCALGAAAAVLRNPVIRRRSFWSIR